MNKARNIQTERFKNDDIHCNARENRHIRKYCRPIPEAEKLLDLAMRELNLSARDCRPDFKSRPYHRRPRGRERYFA